MSGRRFASYAVPKAEELYGLAPDHPAVVEGRTLFRSRVVDAADSPRLLVSGQNQRKIGARIVKGPWKGLPVYTLTLEERATCPTSCQRWRDCYGNAMHWPRRHKHGPELERRLRVEVGALHRRHPNGFAVRLHVLGDFYSARYVALWAELLDHSNLHVFGFTAHARSSEIGACIADLNYRFPGRCLIRFSQAEPAPLAAVVIEGPEAAPAGSVICPAQTGATACCSTCGLCWSTAFAAKTVAFLRHGAIRPWSAAKRGGDNPGLVYPGTGKALQRRPKAATGKRRGRKPLMKLIPGEGAVMLGTTVGESTKAKFAAIAVSQGLTPASLLRRIIEAAVEGEAA